MISRTFASVFPRQSPSSFIFSSINAEADFTGTGLFMYAIVAALSVTCSLHDRGGPAELGRNDRLERCPDGDRFPNKTRAKLGHRASQTRTPGSIAASVNC